MALPRSWGWFLSVAKYSFTFRERPAHARIAVPLHSFLSARCAARRVVVCCRCCVRIPARGSYRANSWRPALCRPPFLCPSTETAARQRNDGAITSELYVRKIMVIGGRVRNSQRSARPSHERIYRIEEDCWKGCNAYHSLYSQIMITNEDSPSQLDFGQFLGGQSATAGSR